MQFAKSQFTSPVQKILKTKPSKKCALCAKNLLKFQTLLPNNKEDNKELRNFVRTSECAKSRRSSDLSKRNGFYEVLAGCFSPFSVTFHRGKHELSRLSRAFFGSSQGSEREKSFFFFFFFHLPENAEDACHASNRLRLRLISTEVSLRENREAERSGGRRRRERKAVAGDEEAVEFRTLSKRVVRQTFPFLRIKRNVFSSYWRKLVSLVSFMFHPFLICELCCLYEFIFFSLFSRN